RCNDPGLGPAAGEHRPRPCVLLRMRRRAGLGSDDPSPGPTRTASIVSIAERKALPNVRLCGPPLTHRVLLLQRFDRVQAFAKRADSLDARRGGRERGDARDPMLQRGAPNVRIVAIRLAP